MSQKIQSVQDVTNLIATSRKGSTAMSAEDIYTRIVQRAEAKKAQTSEKPAPLSVPVTEQARKDALELSYDTDNLIIRYLREDPTVSTSINADGKKTYSVGKGAPYAVLVAFKFDGKLFIGWSKRNAKVIKEVPTDKGVPVETNPFTRQDARYTAILRGLLDSVVVLGDKYARNGAGNKPIPNVVVRELGSFTERARKYFKMDKIVNLVGNI